MKIVIAATHSYPLPSPKHTGDVVILDLARSLGELGHEVLLIAPEGTHEYENVRVLPMPCSNGEGYPVSGECELQALDTHRAEIMSADVVHDFGVTKQIASRLLQEGRQNVFSTPLSVGYGHVPIPASGVIAWTYEMAGRLMRGESDYFETEYSRWGNTVPKVPEAGIAAVVYGGVDTIFYSPPPPSQRLTKKSDEYLWLGRWHPVRGGEHAIEAARRTGIDLRMLGELPEDCPDSQREHAEELMRLARGCPNITFEFLPPDPDHHWVKRDRLRAAKALLFPVRFREPFGLTQAEALACGTPVIGAKLGSVSEVVSDGVTGIVYPPGIDGLEQAIQRFERVNIHPHLCRERAHRFFDRRYMARVHCAVYTHTWEGSEIDFRSRVVLWV